MRMIRQHHGLLQESDVREWSRALFDRMPGRHRLDDVALPGSHADHVVATPLGLLVVVSKWRVGIGGAQDVARRESDLELAAAAARRVRRLVGVAPNPLDVPVYAALLLWGPGSGVRGSGWDAAMGVYVLDGDRPWAWPGELTSATPDDPARRTADIAEALRKVHGWSANQTPSAGSRPLTMALVGGLRRGRRAHRSQRPLRVVRA